MDTTTDKIIDEFKRNLKEIFVCQDGSRLYRVKKFFVLPAGYEINGRPFSEEYRVDDLWYIFDTNAYTKILDKGELEDYFDEDELKEIEKNDIFLPV